MSFLITADQAASYPTLATVPASERAQVLADAAKLTATVQATPLLTRQRLAARGDIDVDRVDRALRVALELGLLLELPETTPLPGTPIPPLVLDELNKDDLMPLAQALDVDGRSTMSKPELIDAIRATGTGLQTTATVSP